MNEKTEDGVDSTFKKLKGYDYSFVRAKLYEFRMLPGGLTSYAGPLLEKYGWTVEQYTFATDEYYANRR